MSQMKIEKTNGGASQTQSLTTPPSSIAQDASFSSRWSVIGGALLALGGALQSSSAQEAQRATTIAAAAQDKASTPVTATCEVIHVGHVHRTSGIPASENVLRRVVESQLKTMDFLLKNPDAKILCEGISTDLSERMYKSFSSNGTNNRMVTVQHLFKNGIPTSADKLTEEQSLAIFRIGAAEVLWLLGKVPTVTKTITEVQEDNFRERIQKRLVNLRKSGNEFASLITEEGNFKGDNKQFEKLVRADPVLLKIVVRERDLEALKRAKDLQAAGAKKVILIYGIGHDFEVYQKDFPELAIRRVNMMPDTPRTNAPAQK